MRGERFDHRVEFPMALIAKTGLTRRRHRECQDVEEDSLAAMRSAVLKANLSIPVSLGGLVMIAMGVDDTTPGEFAEPGKGIPSHEVDSGQGSNGRERHLLIDIPPAR